MLTCESKYPILDFKLYIIIKVCFFMIYTSQQTKTCPCKNLLLPIESIVQQLGMSLEVIARALRLHHTILQLNVCIGAVQYSNK